MSKILIVDDGPTNRELLVQLLNSHHHLAWEASDGAEALQLARMERPDLVISDVLMPTMDGYEFVRQLRADPVIGHTPVIFITGNYLGREARALAKSCGVSTILYRPCDQEEVLESVGTALHGAKNAETFLPVKRQEFDREHLQLLTDKLSEKSDQLSAANLKLSALIELGQQLASEHDPLRLMEEYCRAARELIGSEWDALAVLAEDKQTVQHFYTTGLDRKAAKRISPPPLNEVIFGKALKDGSAFRIRLIDGDPQAAGWPPDFPSLSSCLSLPIMFQEQVYGWLCLVNKLGAEEFSDEDEELAVRLIAQMASAYKNATLYGETRDRTVELEGEIVERKRAEEALRNSEERYRLLFENNPRPMWVYDIETLRFLTVNRAAVQHYGYSREEFLAMTVKDIRPIEDVPAFLDCVSRIPEGQNMSGVWTHCKKDGTVLDADVTSHPQMFEGHQAVIVSINDVTERNQAVASLRQSEIRLKTIIESLTEGLAVSDLNGQLLHFNPAAVKMHGFISLDESHHHLTEYPGMFELSDMGEMVLPREQWPLARILRGEELRNIEVHIRRTHSDWHRVLNYGGNLVHDADGQPTMAVVTISDITERKQAEEARDSLAAIVESSGDAIISKTFEGIVSSWNASAERMYGYTAAEAIGQHISFITPPERADELAGILDYLQSGGRIKDLETVRVRNDGTRIHVSVSISPVISAEGRILGASDIARDITERKRSERAMRAKKEELSAMTQQFWQASKLATIGEMAAGIAHELNNPLATIALRTELLLGQFADGDPKRSALKIIEQEIERMADLVSHLLQFSRRDNLQISTMDVSKELENSYDFIEHYLRSRQIKVVREFANTLPTLHADRQQLRQVFLNLLTNASDAMKQGGTLTLRVATGQTEQGAGAIVIEFADTGMGIKREDLSKVWEPFFTTKDEGKGTGLGLSICRRIVEDHKGTINLESEAGQGTTVRITLPASKSEDYGTSAV